MIRPVVFDFDSASDFLKALNEYNKKTRQGFSIRSRTNHVSGCSPALVTQVLNGKRKLKRDQIQNFAKIFGMNRSEVSYIDDLLKESDRDLRDASFENEKPTKERIAKNHILSHWIYPYVKDLVELEDFQMNSTWMLKKLGGIAQKQQIEKAVEFLLAQGFWRKSATGKIVAEEAAVSTTNETPNEKIKSFHKKALAIAAKGLEEFPVNRRKASTIIAAVNKESLDELRTLINKFQMDLTEFIENHPAKKDELVQVTIHLTPVGGKNANA